MTLGKKTKVALAILATSVGLGACSSNDDIMAGKNSPNEFKVVNRPPLQMPPDYNIRPPQPGEPDTQNLSIAEQAVEILFPGRRVLPPPVSKSEGSLLSKSGGVAADQNIRAQVGDKTTLVAQKGVLIKDVLEMGERNNMPDGSSIERIASKRVKGSKNQ